ncbi:RelA/SpoT domain-containing protein [Pseudomonas sp. NY15374]|uniref:RelA/SpoT domain-containing protein n=1 Tax=Pseudomonas sp. NY15374 TaxID=3400357 RepID=UPI003A87559C
MELENFLSANRITDADWQRAAITWDELVSIHHDHVSRIRQLEDTAGFFVNSIQSFASVHSVRWRVKDPDHLIEKIIRKRAEEPANERYRDISVGNYHTIVTDLIGVRALHLFKDDCLAIHDQVIGMWDFHEAPVSYVREGDRSDLAEDLDERNIGAKVHPAGYRSIHYVLKTKPALREVLVELQVRTVFEEAWSEIDHKVRYPNFSKNHQVEDVLKIFNRLAGSADELGGFVRSLSRELDRYDREVGCAVEERDSALEEMQKLLTELSEAKASKAEIVAKAERLQAELNRATRAIKHKRDLDIDLLFSKAIYEGSRVVGSTHRSSFFDSSNFKKRDDDRQ